MAIRWRVATTHGRAIVILAGLLFWHTETVGWSQVVGDEAEMDRLKAKAEDLMANNDPEGAAMSMGRAALMAKQLATKHKDVASTARVFQGAEKLFRSQEHAYRAMALFRRAGGQLPASSGVCGSLALANSSVLQATSLLEKDTTLTGPPAERATHLRATADDWSTVIASMISEYQCP